MGAEESHCHLLSLHVDGDDHDPLSWTGIHLIRALYPIALYRLHHECYCGGQVPSWSAAHLEHSAPLALLVPLLLLRAVDVHGVRSADHRAVHVGTSATSGAAVAVAPSESCLQRQRAAPLLCNRLRSAVRNLTVLFDCRQWHHVPLLEDQPQGAHCCRREDGLNPSGSERVRLMPAWPLFRQSMHVAHKKVTTLAFAACSIQRFWMKGFRVVHK
mmetsp:Transcript_64449/g.119896  ORF Transcript_64449/g.119896 Transcript_64449/m.119896 type:complete len:215 (+) Transcript_64449:924-1568(+)